MLANAKLSRQVMVALMDSDLLNEYMMAIVQNAGSGPSVKDLLQQEVALRAAEKAEALVHVYADIAADSTLSDPYNTLFNLIAANADASDYYLLAQMALERGRYAKANAYLDSLVLATADDTGLLRDLVSMSQTLGGEWELADVSQRAQLATMANSAEQGSAFAWAIRYRMGETDEIPTAEMPDTEKSLVLERAKAPTPAALPLLQAMPNPTTGTSMLAIGLELDGAALVRVSDPQGRVVRTMRLGEGQRLVELDLTGLSNGLYTCELLQGEYKLAVTKLTVQR
jgi:hypothetical protein